jgi:hypothetical protein
MNIINKKYKLIEKIGSGSFGTIFKGINIRTNELVGIKVELIEDDLKLLKYESNIYKILYNVNGVPKIKWYGRDNKNYYLVLDLLGDSLEDLIIRSGRLKLKLILQIGVNILTILMEIHNKGFIHRDIKPENFLLSIEKPKKLFIIDFGISKPYIFNEKHIDFKITNKFIGTQNFASINCHNFYEHSRRDDLESLCYMLIYFYFGSLDWMNPEMVFSNKEEENNFVKNMKIQLIYNEEIPTILMNFYKNILSLEFNEKPDYNNFINIFKNKIEEL